MPPKAPPKSGKKTALGSAGIDSAVVIDEKWQIYPFLLDPSGPYSSKYIAEAVGVMKQGRRRRFAALTVNDLVEWAKESAKAKAKPKEPTELLVAETCAEAAGAFEEAGAGPLPMDQVARLIKAKMLLQRETELVKREAARQEAAAAAAAAAAANGDVPRPESKSSSRPASKQTVSKTPKPPKSAPKRKGSKGEAIEEELVPGKKKSTLLSRAEEEALIDFIDDEPSSGPDAYWCISGITDPQFFSYMAQILTPVRGVISFFTPDDEDQDKASTSSIWKSGRALCLQAQLESLRNTAWVTLNVGPAPDAYESNDKIAHRLYFNTNQEEKHKTYLSSLSLYQIPKERITAGRVDMSVYRSSFDSIPPEKTSIAAILDAILTQVETTINSGTKTIRASSSSVASSSEFLTSAFSTLAITSSTSEKGLPSRQSTPSIVRAGDMAAFRAAGMYRGSSLEMERRIWAATRGAFINNLLPSKPALSTEERLAYFQQLQTFSKLGSKELERNLLLLEFESFLSSKIGVDASLLNIQDRCMTEHFDAATFPQIFCDSLVSQQAEILYHYYSLQHLMLIALVPSSIKSIDTPYKFQASAPTPLGFSNFLEYYLEDCASGDNFVKSDLTTHDTTTIDHFPAPEIETSLSKTYGIDLGDVVLRTDTTTATLLAADGGVMSVSQSKIPYSNPYIRHILTKDENILTIHNPRKKRFQFFGATLADGGTYVYISPSTVDAISRKGLPDDDELKQLAEEAAKMKLEEDAKAKADLEAAERPKSKKGAKVATKTPVSAPPSDATASAVASAVEKRVSEPVDLKKLFNISITTIEGIQIDFAPDGTIRMSYASSTSHFPPSHPAHHETGRLILPTGVVICTYKSGETRAYLPNGTSALQQSNGGVWFVHGKDGVAGLSGDNIICVSKSIPEIFSETIHSREDGTTFISAENDSSVVEHTNGTRIYTTRMNEKTQFRIESLGFPRIELADSKNMINLPNGTRILHEPSAGTLEVIQSDDTQLTLSASGVCQFISSPILNDGIGRKYMFDFISAEMNTTDSLGSILNIMGDSTVTRNGAPQSHQQLLGQVLAASRLFVVHTDGSATEFHGKSNIHKFGMESLGKPIETLSGSAEGDSNSSYETLIWKRPEVNLYSQAYSKASILPAPLQRNLSACHKEYNQCEDAIVVRQLFKHPSLDTKSRGELISNLKEHQAWIERRLNAKAALRVSDSRSESERMDTERLVSLIPALGTPAVALTSDTASFEQNVKKLLTPAEKPKAKVSGKTRDEYFANDDSASGNLDEMKAHLREKKVPPFFQSEEAVRLLKQTLSRNTAELEALHSGLAQNDQHPRKSSPKAKTINSQSLDRANAGPSEESEQKRTTTANETVSPLPPIRPKSGQVVEQNLRVSSAGKQSKPFASSAGILRTSPFENNNVGTDPSASLSHYQPLPPIRPRSASTITTESTRRELDSDLPEILRSSLRTTVVGQDGDYFKEENSDGEDGMDADVVKDGELEDSNKAATEVPENSNDSPSSNNQSNTKGITKTNSTMSNQPQTRGFDVHPVEVDFGTLKEGCTYAKSIKLRNRGADICRFKVTQPDPLSGLQIIYSHGPVAAGMEVRVDFQFLAQAVNTMNGACDFDCDIEVISEENTFKVPVRATVLTRDEFELRKVSDLHRGKGVRLISTKSPLST